MTSWEEEKQRQSRVRQSAAYKRAEAMTKVEAQGSLELPCSSCRELRYTALKGNIRLCLDCWEKY